MVTSPSANPLHGALVGSCGRRWMWTGRAWLFWTPISVLLACTGSGEAWRKAGEQVRLYRVDTVAYDQQPRDASVGANLFAQGARAPVVPPAMPMRTAGEQVRLYMVGTGAYDQRPVRCVCRGEFIRPGRPSTRRPTGDVDANSRRTVRPYRVDTVAYDQQPRDAAVGANLFAQGA